MVRFLVSGIGFRRSVVPRLQVVGLWCGYYELYPSYGHWTGVDPAVALGPFRSRGSTRGLEESLMT